MTPADEHTTTTSATHEAKAGVGGSTAGAGSLATLDGVTKRRRWPFHRIVLALIVGWGVLWLVKMVVFRDRMPVVEGRVLNGLTGAPVEGAVVQRGFYQPGPFDLVDMHGPVGVPGSYAETITDAQGRYRFEKFSADEMTAMSLLVFKPGLMPCTGCTKQPGWAKGGCSGFGVGMMPDPWTKVTITRSPDLVRIDVTLFPPTVEGIEWPLGEKWYVTESMKRPNVEKHFPEDVDPWGEYFDRLDTLTQSYGPLDRQVFNNALAEYVESGGEMTGEILFHVDHAAEDFVRDPRGHSRWAEVSRTIAIGLVHYCDRNPESTYCDVRWRTVKRTRALLREVESDDTRGYEKGRDG